VAVEQQERDQQAVAAEGLVDQLDQQGVVGVAVTWVDNSGVTRVKAVPLGIFPGNLQLPAEAVALELNLSRHANVGVGSGALFRS